MENSVLVRVHPPLHTEWMGMATTRTVRQEKIENERIIYCHFRQ